MRDIDGSDLFDFTNIFEYFYRVKVIKSSNILFYMSVILFYFINNNFYSFLVLLLLLFYARYMLGFLGVWSDYGKWVKFLTCWLQ